MNRNDKYEIIPNGGVGFLKSGAVIDFDNEDYKSMLTALGYKINNRYFGDTKGLFSKDYAKFNFRYDTNKIIYSGAEHTRKPKLTNITVLPNLQADRGIAVLGSTMGHQHTQAENGDERQFQEIYEFQNHGGMLLRNQKRNYSQLHFLSPGEKVTVGTDDNMTIFNLGISPLVTLDYANPDKNGAQKNLEKKLGSFMTITHQEQNFQNTTFYFNDNYTPEKIEPIIITHANLGQSLFEKIHAHKKDFENRDIEIIFGGNLSSEQQAEFNKPLIDLVLQKNKTLFKILEIEK